MPPPAAEYGPLSPLSPIGSSRQASAATDRLSCTGQGLSRFRGGAPGCGCDKQGGTDGPEFRRRGLQRGADCSGIRTRCSMGEDTRRCRCTLTRLPARAALKKSLEIIDGKGPCRSGAGGMAPESMERNKSLTAALALLIVIGLQGCDLIVNYMAFHPDAKNVISTDQLPPGVREIFVETKDNLQLQCYFLPSETSDRILIYFHGNAGNIGHRLPDLIRLNRCGINVLGVSYRGYGKSQGRPSERGLYVDGEAAFKYSVVDLGFSAGRIFVLGRSIGTSVAIDVARQKNIGGLILVSPLTSGAEMAEAAGLGFISFIAADAFNNIGKISDVRCPVLIIHGNKDGTIPFSMGRSVYRKVKSPKKLVEIQGAGHNDLSTRHAESYWPPICRFLDQWRPGQ